MRVVLLDILILFILSNFEGHFLLVHVSGLASVLGGDGNRRHVAALSPWALGSIVLRRLLTMMLAPVSLVGHIQCILDYKVVIVIHDVVGSL